MPGRIALRSGRPADHGRSLRSGWADAPEESPAKAFRLPPWVPSGRTVSTAIVVVVSIASRRGAPRWRQRDVRLAGSHANSDCGSAAARGQRRWWCGANRGRASADRGGHIGVRR